MQRFVGFLFGAGYGPFSSLVAVLLAPTVRAYALDYATLTAVLAAATTGTTITAPAGKYSVAELQSMVADVRALIDGALTEYKLGGAVTNAQVARLCASVAEYVVAHPAAA